MRRGSDDTSLEKAISHPSNGVRTSTYRSASSSRLKAQMVEEEQDPCIFDGSDISGGDYDEEGIAVST